MQQLNYNYQINILPYSVSLGEGKTFVSGYPVLGHNIFSQSSIIFCTDGLKANSKIK